MIINIYEFKERQIFLQLHSTPLSLGMYQVEN